LIAIGLFFEDNIFEVYTKDYKWFPGGSENGFVAMPNLWTLTKLMAMAADSVMHEAFTHLALGHLICETFAIAYHNAYVASQDKSGRPEVGSMMGVHFVDLLPLNSLARVTIVAQ
jgi:hypothetical protein